MDTIPSRQTNQRFFDFRTVSDSYSTSLLNALAELLSQPYVTEDWPTGVSIMMAQSQETADAVIVFDEETKQNRNGLTYEILFRNSDDVFPGWFSLIG